MSTALAPAITLLVADLQRFASLLDSVLFRELWRAVAVATTRTVFNNVVTEAHFSEQVFKTISVIVPAWRASTQSHPDDLRHLPAAHAAPCSARACTGTAHQPDRAASSYEQAAA